jgi:hypothetical protein
MYCQIPQVDPKLAANVVFMLLMYHDCPVRGISGRSVGHFNSYEQLQKTPGASRSWLGMHKGMTYGLEKTRDNSMNTCGNSKLVAGSCSGFGDTTANTSEPELFRHPKPEVFK